MRASRFFLSLIAYLFAVLLLALGVLGVLLTIKPEFLAGLIQVLSGELTFLPFLGILLILLGILLFVICIRINCKEHVRVIKANLGDIFIDEAVLQRYTEGYFKRFFPKKTVYVEASFVKGKIQLVIDLPSLPLKEQKPFLERAEKDLAKLFERQFRYQEDFFLTASFSN